jgi:simple sugar transport system permease protein
MTSESTTTTNKAAAISSSMIKGRITGIGFLLIALFIWGIFSRTTTPDMKTTFIMTPGASTTITPDWTFNSLKALNIMAALCASFGAFQLFKGFGKWAGSIFGLVGILLVLSFLAWGASGGSINLGGMLRVMVLRSVPITIGALAGILSERAGIFNIAIEGMMISGAFFSSIVGSLYGLWAGVLGGILVGGLMALIHVFFPLNTKWTRSSPVR